MCSPGLAPAAERGCECRPPQEQANAYTLTVGQPVAREMRGGEQHTYQLTLSAGQYARVAMEQKGIDVVLAVVGSGRKTTPRS